MSFCSRAFYDRVVSIALLLLFSLLDLAVLAKTSNLIDDFEIIKADKLSFKDKKSSLEGHTKVRVGAYLISADRVEMLSPENSANPSEINFWGSVFLESKDIDIHADHMDYDVPHQKLRCYAPENSQVVSEIKSNQGLTSKSGTTDILKADYQEFDFIAHKAKAEGRVFFDSAERDISSTQAEIEFNNKNQINMISFLNQVLLLEKDKRVESNDLQYLPKQKLVRIASNTKILYFTDEQKPLYLFADLVVLETERQIFSAYSTSRNSHIRLYTADAYAEARQVIMNQSQDAKLDQAILTGNAYAQLSDKAIVGEEILFDIRNGFMKTLVKRPQTRVFTAAQ